MAHFRSVVFNMIRSSFGSWLTGSVNWTTCRQFGQGPVSQTSCGCLFFNLVKLTPEIVIWRTNLVSQTTNKRGNRLGKTKDAVRISDFLQMNIKFTVQNRFSLIRCSLWNRISHTEKKNLLFLTHIYRVWLLMPFLLGLIHEGAILCFSRCLCLPFSCQVWIHRCQSRKNKTKQEKFWENNATANPNISEAWDDKSDCLIDLVWPWKWYVC